MEDETPVREVLGKIKKLYDEEFIPTFMALFVPQLLFMAFFIISAASIFEENKLEIAFAEDGLILAVIAIFTLAFTYLMIRVSTGIFAISYDFLKKNKTFTFKEIYQAGTHHKMYLYFWTSLVMGLLIILGLIALIIPGIFLMLMWSVALPVSVIEEKSSKEALKKSRQLTKNNYGLIGKIIGIYFLISLFTMIPIIGWAIALVLLPLEMFAWVALYDYLSDKKRSS